MACKTTSADGSKKSPLVMRQGKTFTFSGQVLDADGKPVDLTSYVGGGAAQIRAGTLESPGPVAVANLTIAVTVATQGKYTGTLGATTTDTLAPGLYVFDVEFTLQLPSVDPDDVVFGGEGYILVKQAVTQ